MFDSIGKSSMAAAISVAAVVSLGGAVAIGSNAVMSQALDESQRTADLLRAHQTADMMHDALRADAIAAILTHEAASGLNIEDVEADFQEHQQLFQDMIAEEKQLARSESEKAAIEGVEEPLRLYSAGAERIIALARTDATAAMAAMPEFFEQFHALEGAMENVTDTIAVSNDEAVTSTKADSRISAWLQIGLLILSLMFALALAIAARRFIARPLSEVSNAMDNLADGDLSTEAPGLERKDEIGVLARALERFRAAAIKSRNMQDAMERERRQSGDLQRQAEQQAREQSEQIVVSTFGAGLARLSQGDLTARLTADLPPVYEELRRNFNTAMDHMQETMKVITDCSQSVHVGAAEITHAADDLSRRTEQHAASLEETAAALDELTTTVRGAAGGAADANTTARKALDDAERGAGIVTQAITAMGEIEKSSQQITQIIGVIDEIAFQTNLLALNAGVEAARAGEAGRGFAVVAMEVRSLAQRSADAAKEIKELIATSSEHVESGVALVGDSGAALTQIKERVTEVNELIAQIARSASEQAVALQQVNTAINHMDQGTQQNAAMVEETTAASRALSREAASLDTLVKQFQIEGDAPAQSGRRAA